MNLGDMRLMTRDILGEDSAAFWTDAMLNRFINRAAKEIYATIIQFHEDYFVTSGNISYVASTELYTLPNTGNVAKVVLVERVDGTYKINLLPIPVVRKNDFQYSGIATPSGNERYFLVGSQIGFAPIPTTSITNAVKVWYLPPLADLGTDAATFAVEFTDLHHETIVWLAVQRAVARDKQMYQLHQPHIDRLMQVLINDMTARQDQEPKKILPIDD